MSEKIKIPVDRINFEFHDHNRTISYDLYLGGEKCQCRQHTAWLAEKEYFIRKLKGK